MADQRSLGLVLVLSVIALLIFIVAVACNVMSVATVNWVSLGSCPLTAQYGLWSVCAEQTILTQTSICFNYDPSDDSTGANSLAYVYASRALAIAPPVISVAIILPLFLVGLVARNGIILAFAAGAALLQVACLVSALIVFFVETLLLVRQGQSALPIDLEVIPGWSFYLGAAGAIFYLFSALWLSVLSGVVGIVMEGQGRNAQSQFGVGGIVQSSAQPITAESYKQLAAFPK